MLTKIRLENFKALQDSKDIVLGPITVLVGPNSSGKSSVLQGILAGRQTARGALDQTLVLSDGDEFDLGSFPEVARQFAKPQTFALTFGVQVPSADQARQFMFPHLRRLVPQAGSLRVEFKYLKKSREVYVSSVEASFSVKAEGDKVQYQVTGSPKAPGSDRYHWTVTRAAPESTPLGTFEARRGDRRFFITPDLSLIQSRRASPEMISVLRGADRLFNSTLSRDLSTVRHVGAMRAEPRRAYSLKGTRPQEVGRQGQRAPDIIFSETRRKKSRERLMRGLNLALSEMRIASSVLARIPPGASAYSLFLDHLRPRLRVNVASVGFGVSQILPILVETYHSLPGTLILLEQPEIHLHPRAQARVADLLVSALSDGKRFLVETHSEHLIRRLQVLVADPEVHLAPGDVRIYFFDPGEEGSTVSLLELDQNGQFTSKWPEGFFDESVNLSVEHLEAIARRTKDGGT